MEARGVACVTGAARGLGRALSLELARRGFDVVATMRDPTGCGDLADEARAEGARLSTARLDVDRPGDFAPPPGLRVWVNNAALELTNDAVEHTPQDVWQAMLATNLLGAVELTRRALPALRAAGGGVVCNVTSASLLVPMPFFAAYRASKAALSAFGESLRSEVAPHGIRVLEVLPGALDTDMLRASSPLPDADAHATYRAQARHVAARRTAAVGDPTPPRAAAAAIVDAILDDTAPLRVACDPMGEALLAGWRARDDETWMTPLVKAFDPTSSD
jgi:NAD(P)-dependent dehydrogenase (short-subunit alcohol dehydrogenase family)